LLEPSREIVMGLKGVFYGFGLWKMKFLNIPLIFVGFVLLGIWVEEDERRGRIVNPAEKNNGCSRD
jgi:hypothetical protein